MLLLLNVQSPVSNPLDLILNKLRLSLFYGWPWKESFRAQDARAPLTDEVSRILIVQLGDIGDLVMTSVFLHELRRHFPQAHITLVTAPHTVCLARACPDIDIVEIFDYRGLAGKDWLMLRDGCPAWWKGARQWRKDCLEVAPDLAFAVRQDADPIQLASHILLATSRARWKIGYEHDCLPIKQCASGLLDLSVSRSFAGHEVERQLHLLDASGWPVLRETPLQSWFTAQDEVEVEKYLFTADDSAGQFLVGIHLGAGHSLKRWPLVYFAEIANWLEKEKGCRLFFLGAEVDRNDIDEVMQKAELKRSANLAGKLSLPVAAALMKHLHGFLGNDSGPFHLAVAANIPAIGLYGPADPGRYGPWKGCGRVLRQTTPCSPCSLNCSFSTTHCMQDLLPQTVKEAWNSFFSINKTSTFSGKIGF